MSKIAILSMQGVYNFGSLLQAYGLKKAVETVIPSAEVKYLPIEPNPDDNSVAVTVKHREADKTSVYHIDKYFIHRFLNKMNNKKQNAKFAEFQRENFRDAADGERVDVCIIGSDEVFNACNPEKWGFTTQLYGNVKNAEKVITYAASCGFTSADMLSDSMKERISSAFGNVSAFSVRDANTKDFVECLSGKTPESHLDPVLISDFSEEIAQASRRVNLPENTCIVYSYHNRIHDEDEIAAVKSFAKAHKLKLKVIGASQKWCSDMPILDPFETLAAFSKARFIITDTFHGTIFAAKYNGRFATVLKQSNRNKLADLVKKIGVENHVIASYSDLEKAFAESSSVESVAEILKKERQRTLAYLEKNLT